MASRRSTVGRLTAAAALLALVAGIVSGCGGGSTSTSATDSTTPAPESTTAEQTAAGANAHHAGSRTASEAARPPGKSHAHVLIPKGPPEPGITKEQREMATKASIALSSPAVRTGELSGAYTCDGKDESPPLEWTGIPTGTAELALFVINSQPVEGKLYFDWAVAGLDPTSAGLKAGRLPSDAIVGRGSSGRNVYSICPPVEGSETYIFVLYALPKTLSPRPGFEPRALREQAMKAAREGGLMAASYTKR
jgi:phosphatidylethanolamine-binding protein (PEBP) family uncharacterized protein